MSSTQYPSDLKVRSELLADRNHAESYAQNFDQSIADQITAVDYENEAAVVIETNECPIQISGIRPADYGFRAYGYFDPAGNDQQSDWYTAVASFDPPDPLGLGVVSLAHDDEMQINVVTNTGWNFEGEAYGGPSDWQPPWLVENGTYKIKNVNSGKLAKVSGSSKQDGANVQQWEDTGGENQHWSVEPLGNGEYKLTATHSDKVLAAADDDAGRWTSVVQQSWTDEAHQRWKIEQNGNAYRMRNSQSGMSLDVWYQGTDNGDDIFLWSGNDGDSQRWQFEKVDPQQVQAIEDGSYTIKSVNSGKLVNVSGMSQQDGANVLQWEDWGGENQHWAAESLDNGEYKLTAQHSDNVLAAAEDSAGRWTSVVQQSWTDDPHQRWKIEPVGNDYRIRNAESGNVLDVVYNGTDNGDDIHLWPWQNGDNQRWKLERIDTQVKRTPSSSVKIENVNSGKLVTATWEISPEDPYISQWEDIGDDKQKWVVESLGNGEYTLTDPHTYRVLGTANDEASQGTTVSRQIWEDNPHQHWEIEKVGDDCKIKNVESGNVLDVEGGGTDNGADIQVSDWHGGDSQRWRFETDT